MEGGGSTPTHLVSIAPPSGELQLSYMGSTILVFVFFFVCYILYFFSLKTNKDI